MKIQNCIILSFFILFASCNSTENEKINTKTDSIQTSSDATAIPVATTQISATKAAYAEIIKIDYKKYKEILDILPLLPDSAMSSWAWSKEEREGMVRSIAEKNQFTDTTADYNTIRKITPNYFLTNVVDGSWSVSLYRVSENYNVVITNDMVGDGNDINAYEVRDGHITALNWNQIIGKKPRNYLLKNNTNACKKALYDGEDGAEDIGMFNYNFSDPSLLSVSNHYLTEKVNGDCFYGNEMIFKFNKDSKRFDFVKTTWKK